MRATLRFCPSSALSRIITSALLLLCLEKQAGRRRWPASRSFDEPAAHHGRSEFARDAVMDGSKLLDGNQLQRREPEGAVRYQLLESCDGHLVQPSRYFTEARRSICFKAGPPAD